LKCRSQPSPAPKGVADSAGAGDQAQVIQGAIDLFGQRAGRNRGMAFDRRCAGNEDPLACFRLLRSWRGRSSASGVHTQSDMISGVCSGFRCARDAFRRDEEGLKRRAITTNGRTPTRVSADKPPQSSFQKPLNVHGRRPGSFSSPAVNSFIRGT